MNTEIFDLGKIGITLGGEYDNKVVYEKLTIVLYKGKSYISTKITQGISPEQDILTWQLVAEAKNAYHMLVDAGKTTLTEEEFLDQLVDATKGRYIVKGNIVNAADEEDLTVEHSDLLGIDTLKLANRDNTKGMGYIILRKNKSFAEQVTKENTIYEIRYDFDLNNEKISIPNRCILKFEGGKLINGILIGKNTTIQADYVKIFQDIEIKGTFNNTDYYAEWFGAIIENYNQEIYIQKCINSFNSVTLLKGNYYIDYPIILTSYQSLKGQGDGVLNGTIINKTTETCAEGIPETINKVNLNKNAIILIVPKSDDPSGVNQYNYVTIENVALHGTKSEYGIFASDGRYTFIKNVFIYNCKYGIRVEYSWMQYFYFVRMTSSYNSNPFDVSVGFLINSLAPYSGYTTIKFEHCYVQLYHYGYKLYNCTYGTFDNCACDGSIVTAYWFYNNHGLTINANGNESSFLTDDADSAAYYFEYTEATLNGCYSTADGTNKNLETKYYMKVGNNSRITLINCIHSNDVGNKIKVFWYSCLQFFGERTIVDDDSIFEFSDNSSAVHYYNGDIKRIGHLPGDVVTSNNFRLTITEATTTTSGLMPAGYLMPANNVPDGITDANDLIQGTYYVSGNINNLPDNRWGLISTTMIPAKNGLQTFVGFSDNSYYFRLKGTKWSYWIRLGVITSSTSDRPETNRIKGMQIFDITLNKPIWWTGTEWVDATGATV